MLTEDRARYVMLDVKPGAVVQWVPLTPSVNGPHCPLSSALLSPRNPNPSHSDTFSFPEHHMWPFFWAFTYLVFSTCPSSTALITLPHPTGIPHLVHTYSYFRAGLNLWPHQFAIGALFILTMLPWAYMARPHAHQERETWRCFTLSWLSAPSMSYRA